MTDKQLKTMMEALFAAAERVERQQKRDERGLEITGLLTAIVKNLGTVECLSLIQMAYPEARVASEPPSSTLKRTLYFMQLTPDGSRRYTSYDQVDTARFNLVDILAEALGERLS